MAKQLTRKWWLALVGAGVGIGAVFYGATPPIGIARCSSHLIVQFGERLKNGSYQMDIIGDDYAAHCKITVSLESMLPPDCGGALLEYSSAMQKFYVPTRSARVKVELRRDGAPLVALTVTPSLFGVARAVNERLRVSTGVPALRS